MGEVINKLIVVVLFIIMAIVFISGFLISGLKVILNMIVKCIVNMPVYLQRINQELTELKNINQTG